MSQGLKLDVDNFTAHPLSLPPHTILFKACLPALRAPPSSLFLFFEQDMKRAG
jgi:hypothetical protein